MSPGPLAAAHAALDGPLDCFRCHGTGERGLDRHCLACHKEIAATIDAGSGLHGRQRLAECARCHPDHAGRDFALIQWEEGSPERFDHAKTGYSLEGKHARLGCDKCHQAKFAVSPIAKLAPGRDRAHGYIGLDRACASCHDDPHAGALGRACDQCHTVEGWEPASRFRHDASAYPLTGKHATTRCDACHRAARLALPADARGRPGARWKPLPYGECSDCHDDPHAGRLGPACGRCHVTDDFKTIVRDQFDHDRTRYPLRGRHRGVKCVACHDPRSPRGTMLRFDTCDACHRDAHGGTASIGGASADCAACHSVETFKPSTFTIAMHGKSGYPLVGKHAVVACAACHPKRTGIAASGLGPAAVQLRLAHAACTDCHRDPHRGRFDAGGERAQARGCLACHDETGFRPTTYDIVAHAQSRFPLTGAHRAVPCSQCHKALAGARPTSGPGSAREEGPPLEFRERFVSCRDCHDTPHGTQFDARDDRGACETCHGVEKFKPATAFNHRRLTAFPLTGVHERVPCARCHPERITESGAREVVYRPLPHECRDCHIKLVPTHAGEAPPP